MLLNIIGDIVANLFDGEVAGYDSVVSYDFHRNNVPFEVLQTLCYSVVVLDSFVIFLPLWLRVELL